MAFGILTFVLAALAILFAWWRGGRPERIGAGVLLAMFVLAYAGFAVLPLKFNSVDPVGLAVDLVGLVGFGAIGILGRRIWPLWAASLQLLSSGAHFVRALSIPVEPWVYFWMKSVPTWAVMILLIGGTWAHVRRTANRPRRTSLPG